MSRGFASFAGYMDATSQTPRWTREAFIQGALAALPIQPGLMAFAVVFGALAAQKNLSFIETMVMTGVLYAGMLQLILMQVWPDHITAGALLSMVVLTLTVNGRLILLGAAMRPWFGSLPPSQAYPLLAINTDANWILCMRYTAQGGTDPAFYLSGVIITWVMWTAGTIPGYYFGALLTNPQRFGFDLVMPAFFAAMLIPTWRGARRALPWAVSGAVALAIDWAGLGFWYIVAGAVAGMIAGALLDDRD